MRKTPYIYIVTMLSLLPCLAKAAVDSVYVDSAATAIPRHQEHGWAHRIEAEYIRGFVLHTNPYLKGQNEELRTMNHMEGFKLKYAMMPQKGSETERVYRGVYQGVGMAYHNFNPQLGNPVSAYLFQGAKIATLCRQLSFNYEWNLGLTFGWHPYDKDTNPDNLVIGSKVTAYINLDAYLSWRLSRWMDVNIGWSVTHFSNGNTKFPNCGLNTTSPKLSLVYYPNRHEATESASEPVKFHPHISYDLTLFGSWRRRGYYTEFNEPLTIPGSFAVFGFNFNPMYNMNHWLNLGLSLDGVYDRSANLIVDNIYEAHQVDKPSASRQMALGLSGRAEFVMPYFTINVGVGRNFLNGKDDFRGVYETVNLKLGITRMLYANIGYCLYDFQHPNYLMLGLGIRFNHRRTTR